MFRAIRNFFARLCSSPDDDWVTGPSFPPPLQAAEYSNAYKDYVARREADDAIEVARIKQSDAEFPDRNFVGAYADYVARQVSNGSGSSDSSDFEDVPLPAAPPSSPIAGQIRPKRLP